MSGAPTPSPAPSPTPSPGVWAPRLARILERQRDLCLSLDAMSARQDELVAGDDTDALLGLLGQRQAVVDELTALGAELEPLRTVWETESWRVPPDQRARITGYVEEIGRLIEGIGRRDESARVRLEERRSAVARELAGISRGRGAVAAYSGGAGGATNPNRHTEPRYEDRRG